MNAPKPFRQDDAPGRIPESLIDAVLDGSVDERTRREVSRALRHDATRQRDVQETIEAIDALRQPIDCPDLAGDVLGTLDRKHRFLPARARRVIRQTRLGLGLAALLALGTVALGQRAIPRLASIGAPPTPVSDLAQAIHADAGQAADGVLGSAKMMCASVPLLQANPENRSTLDRTATGVTTLRLGVPGDQSGGHYSFQIDRGSLGTSLAQSDLRGYRLMTIDGGRLLLIETSGSAGSDRWGGVLNARWAARGGSVSVVTTTRRWAADASADEPERASDSEPDSAPDADSSGRGGWVAEELP